MQKKLAALLIVALVSSMFLFASKTDDLLWELQNKAAGLDINGKNIVFEAYKKNDALVSVVNFIFGGGVGSFAQEDTVGGLVCLAGDLASVGLIISGAVTSRGNSGSDPVLVAGTVLLFASRLFGVFRTSVFTKSYNTRLRNVIVGVPDFEILPAVGKKAPGVALVGSVRF